MISLTCDHTNQLSSFLGHWRLLVALVAFTTQAMAERAGVKVHHVCHEHMIHHFYAMGGAIPYARTALKAVGADIKAALSPVKTLSAV